MPLVGKHAVLSTSVIYQVVRTKQSRSNGMVKLQLEEMVIETGGEAVRESNRLRRL